MSVDTSATVISNELWSIEGQTDPTTWPLVFCIILAPGHFTMLNIPVLGTQVVFGMCWCVVASNIAGE